MERTHQFGDIFCMTLVVLAIRKRTASLPYTILCNIQVLGLYLLGVTAALLLFHRSDSLVTVGLTSSPTVCHSMKPETQSPRFTNGRHQVKANAAHHFTFWQHGTVVCTTAREPYYSILEKDLCRIPSYRFAKVPPSPPTLLQDPDCSVRRWLTEGDSACCECIIIYTASFRVESRYPVAHV